MMDRIIIERLRVKTHLGVTAEERSVAQQVLIDVEARCDLSDAAISDALSDTVDYAALVEVIAQTVESNEGALLESLAERVAGVVRQSPGVSAVTVTIEKERPPLPQDVARVAVSIER